MGSGERTIISRENLFDFPLDLHVRLKRYTVTMKATSNRMISIGEAAKAVDVATSVLRYYEQQRLLIPAARTQRGYRMYRPADIDRLRLIRAAQAIGFTLDDIRSLLQLETSGARSCQTKVQALIESRLAEIDQKMKSLRRVRKALGQALDRCRSSRGECEVMKELSPKQRRKK